MHIHLGLDDTDSLKGGCTTYVASQIVRLCIQRGAMFFDHPNLIRLNPNVPWKTKGNASVALRLRSPDPEALFEEACRIVSDYASEGANAGLVMLKGRDVPPSIREFSERAVSQVVSSRTALRLIETYTATSFGVRNRMGLAGALAAVGCVLDSDHTFELLAYRARRNWGKRRIDSQSVVAMSQKTHPLTFNNYDPDTGRILIAPHGPDPVLLGIRGETADVVIEAFNLLQIKEEVEGYMVFRTNQGTGAHLSKPLNLSNLKAYSSGYVQAEVSTKPVTGVGGHVYFTVKNRDGESPCAVYEPTGDFRIHARALIPGDLVEVGGGVRRRTKNHPAIVNIEYLKVLKLARDLRPRNPFCKSCGGRMTSMGWGKGYRCLHCGSEERHSKKILEEAPRAVKVGLYLPPPRAHRHLTKPLQRYGLEKKSALIRRPKDWYWFPDSPSLPGS